MLETTAQYEFVLTYLLFEVIDNLLTIFEKYKPVSKPNFVTLNHHAITGRLLIISKDNELSCFCVVNAFEFLKPLKTMSEAADSVCVFSTER